MSELEKIVFKIGDKVDYLQLKDAQLKYKPVKGTFIWAMNNEQYIIQHPNGHEKSAFLNTHHPEHIINKLKDGLKYIFADSIELSAHKEKVKKEKIHVEPVKMPNISQSLIKDLYDYAGGKMCGLQFEARHIKKIQFPSSAVQKLGQWFEYMCTGALPRDGKIPEPERKKEKIEKIITKGRRLKNGKKTKDIVKEKVIPGELTAPYIRMQIQSERFKKAIKAHGIKIIKTGVELKYQDKKGILDILAEVNGKEAIVDIKGSGLIDDKWNELGWHLESLSEKDKIMIQPVFYKWLWRKLYGRDIPFYFMVFSNTNEYDCLFIEVIVDEDRFVQFEENVLKKTKKMLNKYTTEGFKAYPDVKECAECPLNKTCKSFTDIPLLQTVHY